MDWTTLIGYLITPVTTLFGWFAGTRSRKNTAIQELMKTINSLVELNAALNQRIITLQQEIVEVRRENAELKAGQETMTSQLNELKQENIELKRIINQKR